MPAYRLEVSPSARAQCNGKKPCSGSKIAKGELRMGVWVEFRGAGSFKYRHFGCITPEVIKNWKTDFEEASELDGFDELPAELQAKVTEAWKNGHVQDEDIPETARPAKVQEGGSEEGAAKEAEKKPASKTKAHKNPKVPEEEATKPKKASKKVVKDESDAEDKGASSEAEAPKKKKAPSKKTAKAVKKEEKDEEKTAEEPEKKSKSRSRARKEVPEDEETKPPAKKARA